MLIQKVNTFFLCYEVPQYRKIMKLYFDIQSNSIGDTDNDMSISYKTSL